MVKRTQWMVMVMSVMLASPGCKSMESQKAAQKLQSAGTTMNGSGNAGAGHLWHMKKAEIKTMIGWDAIPQWGIPSSPQKQVTALTMMVPVDWQFSGGPKSVQPNDCNFTSGRLGFVALSPDKKAGMISLPAQVSVWTNDQIVGQTIQQDNQRYTGLQVCRLEQPRPLAQKIVEMARALSKDIQTTGPMEAVPGMAGKLDAAVQQANRQLAQQGAEVTVETGRIPVRSTAQGDDGDGYLTVMQVVRAQRLPSGGTIWTIDYPLQVATFAPAGKYPQYEAMYAAMLDSVWLNSEYTQACMQVSANMQSIKTQMKQRISQIEQQMALDNQNAARQQAAIRQGVQNYASHVYSSVAANHSAALEHSAQQFSLYMGDQALYHDPTTGGTVQLPAGSTHAWASQTGNTNEYILTDSASFDPNGRIGNADWTQMQEVR